MAPFGPTGSAARCAVAASYRVDVQGAVAASADWQTRVTQAGRFRAPREWRWDVKLAERAAALEGPPELLLAGCHADIAFANSLDEVRWARGFLRRVEVEAWCVDLSLFDARVLSYISLPVGRWDCVDIRSERACRRDERRWCHEHQCFINGVQQEGSFLTSDSILRGAYPPVPRCWHAFEVLWGFLAETSRDALMWGIDLAISPNKAEETPHERGALSNALWSLTFSQWAQNVAGELLSKAEAAWNGGESHDSGRLWWITPSLLQGLRDIGAVTLCNGDIPLAERLEELLRSISLVR